MRLSVSILFASLLGLAVAGKPACVQADEEAVEAGARDFAALCSPCHGADGRGHGPAGKGLKTPPADLTRIPSRHDGSFPADLIFETIAGLDMPGAHGTREMPVWGDVFVSEAVGDSVSLEDALKASDAATERITNLVRYLETIQTKP